MFYFGVFIGFVFACGIIGLLVFPPGREAIVNLVINVSPRVIRQYGQIYCRKLARVSQAVNVAGKYRVYIKAFIKRHHLLLLIAGSLVVIPPGLVLVLSRKNVLDGFDDTQMYERNDQVMTLLQGERLTAPPSLPPALFATQEVMQIRPSLIDASRSWQLLDETFSQRLLLVFRIMKERYGYDMAILEGYRSPERQNKLAKMGASVTNAMAYQSYHQFGLAADCAFRRDGKLVISEKDPWAMRGYRLYGEVAESLGMSWGGRWKMMDFGHIEMHRANPARH